MFLTKILHLVPFLVFQMSSFESFHAVKKQQHMLDLVSICIHYAINVRFMDNGNDALQQEPPAWANKHLFDS